MQRITADKEERMLHGDITELILKGFYKVYNTLGYGFLEKVYENALVVELETMGLEVRQQHPIVVYYESRTGGEYFADMLVNNTVVLELKVAEQLRTEHVAQLTNYLKATEMELGLLLNFGKDPEFKRVVFTKRFKNPCISAASV